MEILVLLLVASASLLLSVALPIVAFIRSARVSSEVAALRGRLAAIEEHLHEVTVAQRSPGAPAVTEATAVPPPASDIESAPGYVPFEAGLPPATGSPDSRDAATPAAALPDALPPPFT